MTTTLFSLSHSSWFLRITGQENNAKYTDFVKSQADKVLANAQVSDGVFYNYWPAKGAPGGVQTVSTQGAALGALVGAGQLNC